MSSNPSFIEVEDVAAWTQTNGTNGNNLQTPTQSSTTKQLSSQTQHVARPSVSYRARPRTISSQTTTFLMKLSRLHLEWHISSTTALVYALRSVGNQNVKADKTLVTIDLPDPSCSQPRVVMVEREAALKTILLDSIVSVTFDKEDQTKRVVRVVYWFDKNRQIRGPPTHPPSPTAVQQQTAPSSTPTVVNIAASSTAKQFLLSLTFASYLDARDFHHLLNYMLNYGCPLDPSALFRLNSGTPAEFVVLHAGPLEKKGKLTWSRRYARLYAGFRLVIYRGEKSHLPVNVFSLARGFGEQRMVAKAVGKDQIVLDMPAQQPTATSETDANGTAATPAATPAAAAEPAYFFRFENTRERDRWFAALQIEFDQPLKQLLSKPGSTMNSSASTTSEPLSPKPTVSRAATTVPAGAHMNPSSPAQISHSTHPTSPSNALSPLLSPQSASASSMPTRRTPEPPSNVSSPSSASSSVTSPPAIPTRPPPGAPILQHLPIQLPVPAVAPAVTNTPSPTASPTPPVTSHSPQPQTERAVSPLPPHTAQEKHPTATPAQLMRATSALPSSHTHPVTTPALSKQDLALKSAEMAYTYYSQLLTLCSSPEVLRMSESDELIIPNDGSCGNVNLSQLSSARGTTALPQAANPNLKERRAKEAAASLALSAPSSVSPIGTATTPPPQSSNGGGGSGSFEKADKEKDKSTTSTAATSTSTPAAISTTPSFNPATHQKVTVLGLLHKVQDQALYFPFLSYFRSQYSALLFWTILPTVSVFQSNTPSSSIFTLGNKRGGLLQELDKALGKYQMFMHCSSRTLKESKLLLFEVDSHASTSSSQIGFAFPGFDSQVFDIGRFSILSPSQMFLGLENSFEEDEWNTALKASSVGKELMQSSADLSSLFESSDPEDQNRGRTLMHQAQLEVLHNIALAAHMRARWAEEKQRLREGEVIAFKDVLQQFEVPQEFAGSEDPSLSESTVDTELFQYSRNHMQLEQWIDITYVYSPPRQVLLSHLKVRMEKFPQEHPEAIVREMGSLNLGSTTSDGANELDSSKGGCGSKDVQSSPQSSPRRHYQPNTGGATNGLASSSSTDDDTILLTGLNPLHAGSSVTPTPLTSYAPTRHFLFDAFHYLLFLRLLFDQRKSLLELVENTLHSWLAKYHRDSSKSKASVKYEYITHLQTLAESEKKRILGAMNQLPSNAVMEGIVKLQTRLSTHHTLSTFLHSRNAAAHHDQSTKTTAATLTAEQLAARAAEKTASAAVLTSMLQARNGATATASKTSEK